DPRPVRDPGPPLLLDRAAVGRRHHRSRRYPPRARAGDLGQPQRADRGDALRHFPDVAMTDALRVSVVDDIAFLTINRPEIHNAFDDALIAALTARYQALDADPAVHAVVLQAEGASFSAGADLNWMRRMAGYS